MTRMIAIAVGRFTFEPAIDEITGYVQYQMILPWNEHRVAMFPSRELGRGKVTSLVEEGVVSVLDQPKAVEMINLLPISEVCEASWEQCFCGDLKRHYRLRFAGLKGHSINCGTTEEMLRVVAQLAHEEGRINVEEWLRVTKALPALALKEGK